MLLVYRVDRFSRRLSDLLDLLADLDDAGVSFASATEPFDTSTSIGRMLVQLLGVFAEFERETIIDRITSGMNAKAAKGKWAGGRRPYGYTIDPATSKLVPHPGEAPHVQRDVPALHPANGSAPAPSPTNSPAAASPPRRGKPWASLQVGHVLANPAYAGIIARKRRARPRRPPGPDRPDHFPARRRDRRRALWAAYPARRLAE